MTTPTRAPAAPGIVLAVVIAADVLDLLDSTITTVAAPTVARALHGGHGLVQWLGASYALALGVLLVIGGRLGDRYGKRRTFLIGIAGFTAASIACGLAMSPEWIVTARLVQGAFGALLIPQGFGLLTEVFPRERLSTAFSVFGPVMGLSAVGGPVLAGALIDADLFGLGWRAMFLINIVLGGATLLAALRVLPADRTDASVRIDGLGSALLGGALLGLLTGLITGADTGWGAGPIAALLAGIVLFGLFCQRQRVAADPLIQPSLLRNRGFTAGLTLGLVFFAAVSGLLYALSLYLQGTLGYRPTDAALGLVPIAAGIVIASIACRTLIARFGRTLILLGLLLTLAGTAGLLLLTTHGAGGLALVVPVGLVGLGMGTCFGSVFDIAIGDIAPHEAGSASGSLNAVQQLSNAIGAAGVTTVYFAAAGGMTASLLVVGAVTLACCGLIRLLPRSASAEEHAAQPA